MPDTNCRIIRLLLPEEVDTLRRLFSAVGREAPFALNQVALIGTEGLFPSCPQHFSWGFLRYCHDQTHIDQFLLTLHDNVPPKDQIE